MAAIFFHEATVGKKLTRTDLPAEGLWMPVLPRIVTVTENASWETRNILGVGDVPTPSGRGLTTLAWKSIFPAFYAPSLCRGIPTKAYWHQPGFMVKKMRNLMLNQDIVLATLNDDPQGRFALEQVAGAASGVKTLQFEGTFIETPFRITGFEWEIGAREVVAYSVTMESTQPREHLEAMFWESDLTFVDPATGQRVAGGAAAGKSAPAKQVLRAKETVAAMLIRAFGIKQGTNLSKATNLTLKYNFCDNNGIVVKSGVPIDAAPAVERAPAGKRHTYIMVPPAASALGGGAAMATASASVGVGSKLQGK